MMLQKENEQKFGKYPKPIYTEYIFECGTSLFFVSGVALCSHCNELVNTEGQFDMSVDDIIKVKIRIIDESNAHIAYYEKSVNSFNPIKKLFGKRTTEMERNLIIDCKNQLDRDIIELDTYIRWMQNRIRYRCLKCFNYVTQEVTINPRNDARDTIRLNPDGTLRLNDDSNVYYNNIFYRNLRF